MTRPALTLLAALVLMPGAAFAQVTTAPAFDVASIRPAVPLQQQIVSGQLNVGATITDARVDLRAASLSDLILTAYRIKPFQVEGPDWIRSERFDLQATLPPGATKEQVPEMLQALLAERFHLKVRRENREHSVYALVVADGGHKLTVSAPPAADPGEPPPGARTVEVGGQQMHITQDGRSMSVIVADGVSMRAAQSADGTMQMALTNAPMDRLVDLLTPFLDKPVVEATGLTERYDYAVDLRREDMLLAAQAAARAAGVTLPTLPGAQPGHASDPGGSSVFSSVQKLGLRLDSRRMPLETIIVESAERLPTSN